MPSITLKNLQNVSSTKTTAIYTDLHLDVLGVPIGAVRDILVDNDIDAIKNSLSNLFSTIPGQKLLSPTYGLNLLQFLFEPITSITARMIGDAISNGITRFEPRVVVTGVNVVGNIDQQQYTIALTIRVPTFPATNKLTLSAILSKNTPFTFI